MIKRAAFFRILLLILLGWNAVGCTKRPPPPPPPPTGTPPAETETLDPGSSVDPSTPPLLELQAEPERIEPGDSALLTWRAENADRVVIEPAIGEVDLEGRVKFFPESTTTYRVRAEGAGGVTTESVTVFVGGESGDGALSSEDLAGLGLEDQFQAYVKPVFFDFDSAELDEEARLTLDANYRWLTQGGHREIRFVLEGHTDARGSEEYNLALGDQRAQVVLEYLLAKGLAPDRVMTVSLGEERPADSRDVEAAYALNRRTNFVFLGGR